AVFFVNPMVNSFISFMVFSVLPPEHKQPCPPEDHRRAGLVPLRMKKDPRDRFSAASSGAVPCRDYLPAIRLPEYAGYGCHHLAYCGRSATSGGMSAGLFQRT